MMTFTSRLFRTTAQNVSQVQVHSITSKPSLVFCVQYKISEMSEYV